MRPDPHRSIEKYRRQASTYDRRVAPAQPIRRKAIARLHLQPGDVVLDIGCGTGLSFPLIEDGIGPEGRLIGIDLSPEMVARARERLKSHGWRNISVLESAVEDAEIAAHADAVLFHFTHDIMRSLPALENVFGHVNPGGRVAAAGTKWAPRWAVLVNLYVWYLARRYVTTLEGLDRPWSHLARFVPDLQVEEFAFGGAYIAWGRAT